MYLPAKGGRLLGNIVGLHATSAAGWTGARPNRCDDWPLPAAHSSAARIHTCEAYYIAHKQTVTRLLRPWLGPGSSGVICVDAHLWKYRYSERTRPPTWWLLAINQNGHRKHVYRVSRCLHGARQRQTASLVSTIIASSSVCSYCVDGFCLASVSWEGNRRPDGK